MFADDSDSGNNIHTPPFAPRGSLTGPEADLINPPGPGHGSDDASLALLAADNMNWLYGEGPNQPPIGVPTYVSNLKCYVCPTTRNYVRPDAYCPVNPYGTLELYKFLCDLSAKGIDKNSTNGHSYEVFTTWHRYDLGSGKVPRRTLRTVQSYVNANYKAGVSPGPAGVFTIMDRLEIHNGLNYENSPNPKDGHGLAGANVIFTDGHGGFVPKKKWTDVYLTSQDDSNPNNGR